MSKVMRILRFNMYVLISIFLLSSCNASRGKDDSQKKANNDTQKNESGDVAINNTHVDTVLIKDMQFQPAEIKVHMGDIVVWLNKDIVNHCVSESKSTWKSEPIPSGKTWKKVITQSADYYCAIHPDMKGKIVVE